MYRDITLVLLITCLIAPPIIAGDNARSRMILPIHLILDEDDNKPASEPNVDYSVYKAGAIWPDWDWADPETVRQGQEKIRQREAQARAALATPSSTPPQPTSSGYLSTFLAYFIWPFMRSRADDERRSG